MIASTVGAVLNVLLNYLLIPIFGYIVAAYTTLICYVLFMIMHYIFMRKVCKNKIGGIHIFNDRFIILSTIVLFIMMFGCMLLYKNTVVRYFVIVVMAVLVIIILRKKEDIIKVVK